MVREALSVLDIPYECYPCPIPLEMKDRTSSGSGGNNQRNNNNNNKKRSSKRPLDTSTIDLLSSPSPADLDDHDASDSDDNDLNFINNNNNSTNNQYDPNEWNAAKFSMLAQHRHRAHVLEMCGVMAVPYLVYIYINIPYHT
jgi:hypothetical protein